MASDRLSGGFFVKRRFQMIGKMGEMLEADTQALRVRVPASSYPNYI
jgi:hypothetical protein